MVSETATLRTGHALHDVHLVALGEALDALEGVLAAAHEGAVGEGLEKAHDRGVLLAGRVGDDGRDAGGGEARLVGVEEGAKVEELEEEGQVALALALQAVDSARHRQH